MTRTITRSRVPDVRLQGKRIRFFCDGVEVPHVIAFDMEEGWIDAFCDGCEHGGPGKHIRGTFAHEEACAAPRRYGRITYVWPDGREVEPPIQGDSVCAACGQRVP